MREKERKVYVRTEELKTVEDATDDRRELVAIQVVLHFLALLRGCFLRVDAVHSDLVSNHGQIAEVGERLTKLVKDTAKGFLHHRECDHQIPRQKYTPRTHHGETL